jgi:hypothetical protein
MQLGIFLWSIFVTFAFMAMVVAASVQDYAYVNHMEMTYDYKMFGRGCFGKLSEDIFSEATWV